MASITSFKKLSATALAQKILQESNTANPSFAIVDVRDGDYVGGHIKGSTNVPSMHIDSMMPTLVRKLEDKAVVVFHCALSQQRGPSAALKYLRKRSQDGAAKDQEVYVLDEGFFGWQREFGSDERLTEGYIKELWDKY